MSDQRVRDGGAEPATPDRRQALPISEVAALLGVSPMTIRRAITSGEFPHVPVRSKRLVPRTFVDELLATPKRGTDARTGDDDTDSEVAVG